MVLSGILSAQQTKITSLGPNGGVVTHLTGSLNDDVLFSVVEGNAFYRSVDGGENWNKVPSLNMNGQNFSIGEISIHPQSSDTILMATSSGFYRSNDKGITWSVATNIPYPTRSVEYSPANPAILFGSDDNGVLRSNDAGKTWFPLKDNWFFGNRPVYRIAIHPSDTANIRVIVSTGFNDTTALFFTPNGGETWTPFNKNLPQGAARRIYALEIDTTGLLKRDFRVVVGTADGIYACQTDYGDTAWQPLKSNSLPVSGVITGGVLVYDRFDPLAGDKGEHKFSFYLSSNASEYDGKPMPTTIQNGLFKIDSRLNSIITINPFNQPPVTKIFSGASDIMSIFCPSRKDKGKIYIGTTAGIFVSNDTGNTWQQKNNGIMQMSIRNLVSLQQTQALKPVFAGIYGGGVYRSDDEGLSWSAKNIGLTNPYVISLATDKKRNLIFAGTAYTLYRSTNYGNNWTSIFSVDSSVIVNRQKFLTRENEMTVRVSPRNADYILFYSIAFGFRLTKNGGTSWSLVKTPYPTDTLHAPEHFEFDPIDSSTIYFAGQGLFKSTNLGQIWTDISGNLPKSSNSAAGTTKLRLMTVSPTINPMNNKEIFLPSFFDTKPVLPYSMFKTTNGGATWDSLGVSAFDVIYDSFDDRKLTASGPFGIFGSEDGGFGWKKISDSLLSNKFMLIDAHATNQNIYYIGGEDGAYKLEFLGSSSLKVDSTDFYFGSVLTGKDSMRTVLMSNAKGTRKVFVRFSSLTDTISFRYLGPRQFDILPGSEVRLPVRFLSTTSGMHGAKLNFVSNDITVPATTLTLTGHTFTRPVFDNFVYDFGSVTVGADSTMTIPINNKEGLAAIKVSYLETSGDTAAFAFLSAANVTADSGKSAALSIKFNTRTVGEKVAYMRFSTTDVRYPLVQFRFHGIGIAKNFLTRKILIDSSVGFHAINGMDIAEYYKTVSLSLRRADIAVQYLKSVPFDGYSALVFVQPDGAPPAELVDSLQRYVNNGGTLVIVGDYGSKGNQNLTAFLDDAGWEKKFKTKTGIRFNTNLLVDSGFIRTPLAGAVVARPSATHAYTYNVDSIVTFMPGSVSVDTSLHYAEPLLTAKSGTLFSVSSADTAVTKISDAYIAATTKIGKGRIVALADYDIWWNGIPGDTTKLLGIFSGSNLQLAFNIFGLVDNLPAVLEPTPQEAYEMLSIPYAFADSSVEAMFKDLGKPNKLLWRMFGKYDQRSGYAEFPDDFKSIRRGEGYWLIAKNPVIMNLGTTTVQGTEEDFEIVLHSGYNMIGNPFPYKVSWKNSFRADSVEKVIWSYSNGKYDSLTQNMEAFQGYWVKNRGVLPKIIRINSLQVSETGALPKKNEQTSLLEPKEWKIRLSAQTSKSADIKNFIGVLNTSVDGLDENDFSDPPSAPEQYVSISLRHQDGRLAADYRALNPEGNFWDFDLSSSDANIPVTISIAKFGAINPEFRIYLLDNKQERAYDMSDRADFQLTLEKNEKVRPFRIIVGSRAFIEKSTNGIPIVPLAYSLSQNYPNPFNPVTTIQYSVSHSGTVTLEIFNILGQKITALVSEFQPIGSYHVQWDGKNDLRNPVASGIYYYRIRINEFSSVKKMTFIK
jgi:photosystem II stability/assembly factor-like uncharacterized protein